MGFFVRKRIKIAPGLHLNVGKTRSSVSVGGRGIGYNFGLTGRKRGRATDQAEPAQSSCLGTVIVIAVIGLGLYAVAALMSSRGEPKPAPAPSPAVTPVPIEPVKVSPKIIEPVSPDKEPIEPESITEPVTTDEHREEKTAARLIALAKTFVNRGDKPTAKKRLKEIIDQHDGTAAADEAKELLKKVE